VSRPPSAAQTAIAGGLAVAVLAALGHAEQVHTPAHRTISDRSVTSIVEGATAERWSSNLTFDPHSRVVRIALTVRNASDYVLPTLRPEHFAVYEDGRRQTNVTVEIEHAPVRLAVLLEGGGRYQQLNREIARDVQVIVRPLLGSLRSEDRVAVFSYADALTTLKDFDQPLSDLERALSALNVPGFSEANFYDAVTAVLARMTGIHGRKALLVVTSGTDTFSRATFEDVLSAARRSGTPIFVIDLSENAAHLTDVGPLARLDWTRVREELRALACVAGGRIYSAYAAHDAAAIYDDIMEYLRIRYVITYVSPSPPGRGARYAVRVELVDRHTGRPLRIVGTGGRSMAANIIARASYES